MERFGQHGLAGKPGRRMTRCLFLCPGAVRITPAQQGNKKTGIND
jgi:hypothetical protein